MQHTTLLIAQQQRHRLLHRQPRGPLEQRGAARPELLRRIAIATAVVVLVGVLGWALKQWVGGQKQAPRQQVARIAILPDAPPPPPPPPPKERPPEAKTEAKPQPTPDNTPKPPAPANEPLKMEGAAGNGPSAFQAGSVSRDYQGGPPAVAASGPGGTGVADRAAERLYASSLRQALRDEIERQLPTDAGEMNAQFALWVSPEGRLQRWELDPKAPADTAERSVLSAALGRSAEQLRLPPPAPAMAQPLRFRMTLRAGG